MTTTGDFGAIEQHHLFPTPLLRTAVHDAGPLNAELMAEMRVRRAAEPGVERSNRNGWHSAADFFKRSEPAHRRLAEVIRGFVGRVTADQVPQLPPGFSTHFEGWLNVSPTHAMNAPHDHPGAFWSGTYYVAMPPPAEAADQLSGAIEFLDPRGSLGQAAHIPCALTLGRIWLRPAAGALLLWPAHLRHWVHPNTAVEERVSVSFNVFYAPGPGAASAKPSLSTEL